MSDLTNKYPNLDNKLNKNSFLPANKQWVLSQYNYNKHQTKDNQIKSSAIEKVISCLINSYPDNKKTILKLKTDVYGSKTLLKNHKRRLRNKSKILRKSFNKIIITRPEVKLTNDLLTLNLHIYNGQINNLVRRLFLLKSSLKKINPLKLIIKQPVLNLFSPEKPNFSSELSPLKIGPKNRSSKFKTLLTRNRIKYNFFNRKKTFKSKQNLNAYQKTLIVALVRKQIVLKAVLFFRFLKRWLLKFGIKIYLFKFKSRFILSIKTGKVVRQIKIKFPFRSRANTFRNSSFNIFNRINRILLNITLLLLASSNKLAHDRFSISLVRDSNSNNMLLKANKKEINLDKHKLVSLKRDFELFKKRYLDKLLTKVFKKEKLIFTNFFLLTLNNWKLSQLITKIKLYLQKISNNKPIRLNLISFKQIFLHADLITNALAMKLRPRKANILRQVKKFFNVS